MAADPDSDATGVLQGRRVALLGRLASMSRREAQALVRQHGGTSCDEAAAADLVVMGEHDPAWEEGSDAAAEPLSLLRRRAQAGELELISETELWQRLGLVEATDDVQRLYTPAMLADLLGVPVAIVRRWHRRGLLVPVREVRRLAYFDFAEVATARRMAELYSAGVSPAAIERTVSRMGSQVPGVVRPLAELPVVVDGKLLLLRRGERLLETRDLQQRFDFESIDTRSSAVEQDENHALSSEQDLVSSRLQPLADAETLAEMAFDYEELGQLDAAADTLRAAMAAGGPRAEWCFQLAELLYRQGDLSGARERYYMTLELDEEYVEARCNLGCVLADQGEAELAVAAFEGALAAQGDYPDARYLLARTLDELQRTDEAAAQWQAFLELAPESPWAEDARVRLGCSDSDEVVEE